MTNRRLLRTGLIGTTVAAICCFTPLLVWGFVALGLGAAVAYLDLVLLPLLGIFVMMTGVALWRTRRTGRS